MNNYKSLEGKLAGVLFDQIKNQNFRLINSCTKEHYAIHYTLRGRPGRSTQSIPTTASIKPRRRCHITGALTPTNFRRGLRHQPLNCCELSLRLSIRDSVNPLTTTLMMRRCKSIENFDFSLYFNKI